MEYISDMLRNPCCTKTGNKCNKECNPGHLATLMESSPLLSQLQPLPRPRRPETLSRTLKKMWPLMTQDPLFYRHSQNTGGENFGIWFNQDIPEMFTPRSLALLPQIWPQDSKYKAQGEKSEPKIIIKCWGHFPKKRFDFFEAINSVDKKGYFGIMT